MPIFPAQRLLRTGAHRAAAVLFCVATAAAGARPQHMSVTLQVEIEKTKLAHESGGTSGAVDATKVVIWLKPLDAPAAAPHAAGTALLVQHNKSFDPHMLVIEVGSIVQFPNRDPFFHNVFSLFNGKRFDLGLYEAGTSHSVRFDRPGVSFLFCNIHPEMSAVVVAVDTPYYAVSDRSGRVSIPNVPDGRYEFHVWYERSLTEDTKNLTKVVTITDSLRVLDTVHLTENPNFTLSHKNKFGQDYVPPPTTAYPQQ